MKATTTRRPKGANAAAPRRPKQAASTRKFATHEFSLVYPEVPELTRELLDALYEAGCSDATVGLQGGVLFVDFARKAPSFRIALASAISDVECSGLGLELVRVEPISSQKSS